MAGLSLLLTRLLALTAPCDVRSSHTACCRNPSVPCSARLPFLVGVRFLRKSLGLQSSEFRSLSLLRLQNCQTVRGGSAMLAVDAQTRVMSLC